MLTEIPLRSVRDRVLAIRSLDSMAGLDDDAVHLVAENSKERSFKKGDVVTREGSGVSHVYLVLDGKIVVTRHGRHVADVVRSRGVGFLSLFARDENGVTAVAAEDTSTLELPVGVVLEAVEESFSFLRNSLRLASRGLIRRRGNLPVDPDRAEPALLGTWRDEPLTVVERVIALRKQGLFARSNLDAVFAIARRSEEVRIEPGQALWEVGDPSRYVVRIDYGRVRCEAPDGSHVVVGAGFVLGGVDGFAEGTRAYSARAETAVLASRTSSEVMLAVLESHVDLALDLQAVFSAALLEGN